MNGSSLDKRLLRFSSHTQVLPLKSLEAAEGCVTQYPASSGEALEKLQNFAWLSLGSELLTSGLGAMLFLGASQAKKTRVQGCRRNRPGISSLSVTGLHRT